MAVGKKFKLSCPAWIEVEGHRVVCVDEVVEGLPVGHFICLVHVPLELVHVAEVLVGRKVDFRFASLEANPVRIKSMVQ